MFPRTRVVHRLDEPLRSRRPSAPSVLAGPPAQPAALGHRPLLARTARRLHRFRIAPSGIRRRGGSVVERKPGATPEAGQISSRAFRRLVLRTLWRVKASAIRMLESAAGLSLYDDRVSLAVGACT